MPNPPSNQAGTGSFQQFEGGTKQSLRDKRKAVADRMKTERISRQKQKVVDLSPRPEDQGKTSFSDNPYGSVGSK